MLRKFVSIRNVGRFAAYGAVGDVELRKLALVYSENARGKTTLCAILRSLQTGEPRYIDERKTLGQDGAPAVTLLLEGGNASFRDGTWSQRVPRLLIFDEQFVDDNVYSGLRVDHEHRKGLCRFAIGEEGVRLANQVDEYDDQSRSKAAEIRHKTNEIQPYIAGALTVDNFVRLTVPDDVEAQLDRKRAEVESLTKANEIAAKGDLQIIELPDAPGDTVRDLLAKKLDDVRQEAIERVRSQIHDRLDAAGEQWLSKGHSYVREDKICPFCAQPLEGLDLIQAYDQFFSESYAALKQEVTDSIHTVSESFSETAILAIQRRIQSNLQLATFWNQYVDATVPTVELERLQGAWTTVRDILVARLRQKAATPLEAVEPGAECRGAIREYAAVVGEIGRYNEAVRAVNGRIAEHKERTATGNLATAQNELQQLTNAAKRNEEAVNRLCVEYLTLKMRKTEIEAAKVATKERLDGLLRTLLPQYQNDINRHLADFGADFRICNTEGTYTGGTLSSRYCLSIRDTTVDLEEGADGTDAPCMKNTLSAGDRNALALAFFLSKLDSDTQLAESIVVLDDPMCSLDRHRKTRTVQRTLDLSARAGQLIVMSHDAHFLRAIWDRSGSQDVSSICVTREGAADSTIQPWNIAQETQGDYLCDYDVIADFVERGSGNRTTVVRCVRQVLEGNLRYRFPREFRPEHTLGAFLGRIRDADGSDPLAALKPHYEDLSFVNEFTEKHYHSRTRTGAENEPITDAELKSCVEAVLRFLPGT